MDLRNVIRTFARILLNAYDSRTHTFERHSSVNAVKPRLHVPFRKTMFAIREYS
jgi:hypothetical protein